MYNSKEKCKEIAQKFRQICEAQGTTPYKVARKAGLSSSTISCFLAGRTIPRVDTMLMLCNQLGISVTDFFEERELAALQTQEEENLLDTYRSLSAQKKELLQIYLKMLMQYEDKENSNRF